VPAESGSRQANDQELLSGDPGMQRSASIVAAALGLAALARPQTLDQFHVGTMAGGYATGARPVLLAGIQFRDRTFRRSVYELGNRVFGPTGLNVSNHIQAMSFGTARLSPALGVTHFGYYTMVDDPDTGADESSYAHAVFTTGSTAPILYLGIRDWTGKFLSAAGGGGGAVMRSGQTGIADPTNTPWEILSLVDLNRGRLLDGDLVGFKSASGHWLRKEGSLLRADATAPSVDTWFLISRVAGSGEIDDGDSFYLRSSSGHYVRSAGSYTTVNATSPQIYDAFTLVRGSVDQMRMVRDLLPQIRARWSVNLVSKDLKDAIEEAFKANALVTFWPEPKFRTREIFDVAWRIEEIPFPYTEIFKKAGHSIEAEMTEI